MANTGFLMMWLIYNNKVKKENFNLHIFWSVLENIKFFQKLLNLKEKFGHISVKKKKKKKKEKKK